MADLRCPGAETVVAYLAAAADASVRARVNPHVDRCPSCRALMVVLVESGAGDVCSLPSLPQSGEAEAFVPHSLGRYELVEMIGAGAMGIVFRAHDPQLRRDVAIKLLRPREPLAGGPALLDEAKAMAAVAHPNVVSVYDVGSVDGRVYLAMELVRGRTLRQWWAEDAPPPRACLRVLLEAGEGLAAIHAAGLVHGDFKPQNVLVADDGRVFVTDFGLARSSGVLLRGNEAHATDPGSSVVHANDAASRRAVLMGTPFYMAPELLGGGLPSQQGDQFAFCVTMFEMLHGRRPFAGTDLDSLRDAIVANRIERQEGDASAAISKALDAAIVRGLRANPQARYVNVRELLDVLANLERRAARRWRARWSAGVVAAVGGTVTGWAIASADPTACELDPLSLTTALDGQQAAIAEAIVRARPKAPDAAGVVVANVERWAASWREQVADACSLRTHDRETAQRRIACLRDRRAELTALITAMTDAATTGAAIDHALALAPGNCNLPDAGPVAAESLRAGLVEARVANWTAQHDTALRVSRALLEGRAGIHDASLRAAVRAELGLAQIGGGDVSSGISTLQRAVLEAQAAGADDVVARTGPALVMSLAHTGRVEETDAWLRHAEAAAARIDIPLLRASVDYAAGAVAHRRRDFSEARKRYIAALSGYESNGGAGQAPSFAVVDALARLDYDQGDGEAALRGFERALAIAESTWGLEHPEVASLATNIAPLLVARGESGRARDLLRSALAGQTAFLGAEHPALGMTHMQLGLLALMEGELEVAQEHLERCLDVHRRQPTNIDALTCRLNLAQARLSVGDCEGAMAHYHGLADALEASASDDEHLPMIAATLHGEAFCALADEPARAQSLLLRLEAAAAQLEDDSMVAQARFYRAQARWALGHRGRDTIALAQEAASLLAAAHRGGGPEMLEARDGEDLHDQIQAWLRARSAR